MKSEIKKLLCWLGFHDYRPVNFLTKQDILETIKSGVFTMGFAQMAYFKCDRCQKIKGV